MDDDAFGGPDPEDAFEETAPDDAFAALSDPTRIDILRALWTADEKAVAFSTLRDRVGMRDSGRFNYHLNELVGRYVAKTEDGYRLRLAGIEVVGSLLAGEFTVEEGIEPIPLDEPCPSCGGDRTFRYDGEWVTVDCDGCDVFSTFGVPPGVFAPHDRDAFPAVAMRFARTRFQQVVDGFCPNCQGRSRPTVRPVADESDDVDEQYTRVPTVEYDCERCGDTVTMDPRVALRTHPAVVSFYHDNGVDIREVPLWEFGLLDPDHARIVDRDPVEARVSYETGGGTLTLTVDEELTVLDVEKA